MFLEQQKKIHRGEYRLDFRRSLGSAGSGNEIEIVQENYAFDANAKLLNFTSKLKTACGKYTLNIGQT